MRLETILRAQAVRHPGKIALICATNGLPIAISTRESGAWRTD